MCIKKPVHAQSPATWARYRPRSRWATGKKSLIRSTAYIMNRRHRIESPSNAIAGAYRCPGTSVLTTISLHLLEPDCASNRKAASALHSEAAGRSRPSALLLLSSTSPHRGPACRAAVFGVLRFDSSREGKAAGMNPTGPHWRTADAVSRRFFQLAHAHGKQPVACSCPQR
jgi:hypothetical protein